MNKTGSYFENVSMPDDRFRIKSFVATCFEHCITVHPHWHNETEILYVISGSATQQVNDRIYMIQKGDIIIIGRNQLHSTYSHQNEECEIMVIMFDKSSLFDSYASDSDCPELFENAAIFKNPIKTGETPGSLLLEHLTNIHKELSNRCPGYRYAVKSQVYGLASLLVRGGFYRLEVTRSRDLHFSRSMLENTFRLIDDCYDQEIGIHTAAVASNLSDSHFCRLFKKTTGMTFKTYLTFFRVNKAETMLHANKTVTEAAMDCGFGSVSSFVRSFKKYKNCTPSAQRQRPVSS